MSVFHADLNGIENQFPYLQKRSGRLLHFRKTISIWMNYIMFSYTLLWKKKERQTYREREREINIYSEWRGIHERMQIHTEARHTMCLDISLTGFNHEETMHNCNIEFHRVYFKYIRQYAHAYTSNITLYITIVIDHT